MVKIEDDTKLSLHYNYDGESKLTEVIDEKGNQVVGYSYDTNGNLSQRNVLENNLTTTYTYDYQNRLTFQKNQTDSAGVIPEYQSEYLTNRQKMTVGNKVPAYKYNKDDELLRTDTLNTDTEEDSVVIYKNDKNGNQLATVNRYEIPSDKKDDTYVDIDVTLGDNRLNENVVNHYNALNQLTQTLTKNYKVSFAYDAEGLRTSKTVNGEKTVFVWDGDQLVMELSDSGKVQKRYIRGNDLVYADKGTDSEKQYYVTDPHGNVVQLTDESGAVTKTYEYDSFGNEVKPDGKDDNPFRYCGEYYDKETEEIYLRARYYQPEMGRFLTRDTYTGEEDEPLSLHLYTYCANDGVNVWDPSGHKEKEYVHAEKIDSDSIRKKYNYNKKHDYFKNYIYDQKDKKVGKMKFQNSTIKAIGCGPVAVYNAFLFSGHGHMMSMVNKEVEVASRPFFKGGASVEGISKVLKNHQLLRSEMDVKKNNINKQFYNKLYNGAGFILFYEIKNKRKKTDDGNNHFVFGVFLESKYRIWNATSGKKNYCVYRSLKQIENLKKLKHIQLIGMKNT